MALTKVSKSFLGFSDDTDFVKLPSGTTAQRPGSPIAGHFRFNTTTNVAEVYDGTLWLEVGLAIPIISSLAYPSGSEANPDGGETIVLTGINFPSSGAIVKVGGATASSITHTSSTSLSFTSPAKSAGDYDVTMTSGNGTTGTLTNGISYSGIPTWTTAAGTIGSFLRTTTPSVTVTVVASSDSAVTYSITSGALPTGFSLADLALKWILMNKEVTVVIPGAKNKQQAENNILASEKGEITEIITNINQVYKDLIEPDVKDRW